MEQKLTPVEQPMMQAQLYKRTNLLVDGVPRSFLLPISAKNVAVTSPSLQSSDIKNMTCALMSKNGQLVHVNLANTSASEKPMNSSTSISKSMTVNQNHSDGKLPKSLVQKTSSCADPNSPNVTAPAKINSNIVTCCTNEVAPTQIGTISRNDTVVQTVNPNNDCGSSRKVLVPSSSNDRNIFYHFENVRKKASTLPKNQDAKALEKRHAVTGSNETNVGHLNSIFQTQSKFSPSGSVSVTKETTAVKPPVFGKTSYQIPYQKSVNNCLVDPEFGIRIPDSSRLVEQVDNGDMGLKIQDVFCCVPDFNLDQSPKDLNLHPKNAAPSDQKYVNVSYVSSSTNCKSKSSQFIIQSYKTTGPDPEYSIIAKKPIEKSVQSGEQIKKEDHVVRGDNYQVLLANYNAKTLPKNELGVMACKSSKSSSKNENTEIADESTASNSKAEQKVNSNTELFQSPSKNYIRCFDNKLSLTTVSPAETSPKRIIKTDRKYVPYKSTLIHVKCKDTIKKRKRIKRKFDAAQLQKAYDNLDRLIGEVVGSDFKNEDQNVTSNEAKGVKPDYKETIVRARVPPPPKIGKIYRDRFGITKTPKVSLINVGYLMHKKSSVLLTQPKMRRYLRRSYPRVFNALSGKIFLSSLWTGTMPRKKRRAADHLSSNKVNIKLEVQENVEHAASCQILNDANNMQTNAVDEEIPKLETQENNEHVTSCLRLDDANNMQTNAVDEEIPKLETQENNEHAASCLRLDDANNMQTDAVDKDIPKLETQENNEHVASCLRLDDAINMQTDAVDDEIPKLAAQENAEHVASDKSLVDGSNMQTNAVDDGNPKSANQFTENERNSYVTPSRSAQRDGMSKTSRAISRLKTDLVIATDEIGTTTLGSRIRKHTSINDRRKRKRHTPMLGVDKKRINREEKRRKVQRANSKRHTYKSCSTSKSYLPETKQISPREDPSESNECHQLNDSYSSWSGGATAAQARELTRLKTALVVAKEEEQTMFIGRNDSQRMNSRSKTGRLNLEKEIRPLKRQRRSIRTRRMQFQRKGTKGLKQKDAASTCTVMDEAEHVDDSAKVHIGDAANVKLLVANSESCKKDVTGSDASNAVAKDDAVSDDYNFNYEFEKHEEPSREEIDSYYFTGFELHDYENLGSIDAADNWTGVGTCTENSHVDEAVHLIHSSDRIISRVDPFNKIQSPNEERILKLKKRLQKQQMTLEQIRNSNNNKDNY